MAKRTKGKKNNQWPVATKHLINDAVADAQEPQNSEPTRSLVQHPAVETAMRAVVVHQQTKNQTDEEPKKQPVGDSEVADGDRATVELSELSADDAQEHHYSNRAVEKTANSHVATLVTKLLKFSRPKTFAIAP